MKIKKRTLYFFVGILIVVLILFTIPKYFTGNVTASEIEISGDIEKLEIIHFHGNNQCWSCIAMGDLAEKTINTYFADELKSGKITFAHLNGELPENKELVMKYEVKSSSLWMGTYYTDGKFSKEENINVWYKINNEQDYMDYLKSVIESKISGD